MSLYIHATLSLPTFLSSMSLSHTAVLALRLPSTYSIDLYVNSSNATVQILAFCSSLVSAVYEWIVRPILHGLPMLKRDILVYSVYSSCLVTWFLAKLVIVPRMIFPNPSPSHSPATMDPPGLFSTHCLVIVRLQSPIVSFCITLSYCSSCPPKGFLSSSSETGWENTRVLIMMSNIVCPRPSLTLIVDRSFCPHYIGYLWQ